MIEIMIWVVLAMLAVGMACCVVVAVVNILMLPFRALMWIGYKWAPPNDVTLAMWAAEREAQQSLRDSQ